MAHNKEIQKALKNLDTTNEDHWTNSGLPKLAALEIDDVKRADVSSAAPHFTRDNPTVELEERELPNTEDEGLPDFKPKAEPKPTKKETCDLEAEHEEAKEVMTRKKKLFEEAKEELDDAILALDNVQIKIDKNRKSISEQEKIQNYIKAQHEMRMKRALARQH